MNAEEMHALACQYAAAPTEHTLNQALAACLPLCALIARRFSGRGAEYDDLYQAACLACVGALKGFQPERGLRFTTYVTPTVTGAVRNYLRDAVPLVRTPRALRHQAMEAEKARDAYLSAHHAEPTARQLAALLGWDLEKVLRAWAALSARHVSSLEETDGDGLSLSDRLPFLEPGYERAEQREDVARALAGLTEEERRLLALRFSQCLSQRDTARQMMKTQMQISRMERRVLAALRKELTPEP